MLRCRLLVVFASAIFLLTAMLGSAAAATPPTKAQQLQNYLVAVRPLASEVSLAQFKEADGAILMNVKREFNDFDRFRSQCRTIGLASSELKKVARPAFLAEPHATLVAAWRSEAVACAKYAAAVQAASDTADSDFHVYQSDARSDERHWRTEVTIQLRRLGRVVPKWVTKVGASPLASK